MLSSFEESVDCRNQRATHEHTSVPDTSEGSNQEPSFARVLRIMNEPLPSSSRTLNVVRRIRGIRAWIVAGGDTKIATVEPIQFVHNGIYLLRAREWVRHYRGLQVSSLRIRMVVRGLDPLGLRCLHQWPTEKMSGRGGTGRNR